MQVKHRQTGLQQTISPEDFDILKSTGHAQNFIVISQDDYVPEELTLTLPGIKQEEGKKQDVKPKEGDKKEK